jgi:hypothetical protein
MFGYLKTLSDEQVTSRLIYGLLDSSYPEVQQFAKEMVQIYPTRIDVTELMIHASESPSLEVQAYALELANRARWNIQTFKQMTYFFRKVLFYVGGSRQLKKRVFELFQVLGMISSELGEQILSMLSDVIRTSGKQHFEKMLWIIVQIQRKYPQLKNRSIMIKS